MAASYAKPPEVVTGYAKPGPRADDRKDIRHIVRPL